MVFLYFRQLGVRLMQEIRIGIVGYGSLGKSALLGIRQNPDMKLVGIFTRRSTSEIKIPAGENAKAYNVAYAANMKDNIDVMLLCGGSMSDLPEQGPEFLKMFNTVDGYDTHAKIPEYFEMMNKVAKESGKVGIISAGWDPGMFSLNRLLGEVILPTGKGYTFWGKGVSQGHSDAIRRVRGVLNAKQYTIPIESAIESVRSGNTPKLPSSERHIRECFVVAEEGADKARIEHDIKTMPNYFANYNTIVHFITEEELIKNHNKMSHGGFVIRSGKTGVDNENGHTIEYSIKLDSNPDFTANILLAYARAAYRLNKEGITGAKTVFDIAPAYLSVKTGEELRKELL